MVDDREYCQTQSHFPESLTFILPVPSVHDPCHHNAFILIELHSELTDGEIWSRPRGKTLANPRDSFYLKVKSTRSSSHWQLWTCMPYSIGCLTEINQAHLSAAPNEKFNHPFEHKWLQWMHVPSPMDIPKEISKEHLSDATPLFENIPTNSKLILTKPTTRTSFVLPLLP